MRSLRIAHTYDFGSFAVIKALLENMGIQVLDIAIGGHLAIAGADQGYYIEVIPSERLKAVQILQDNDLGKYILDSATE
jgi:hypothetical protein